MDHRCTECGYHVTVEAITDVFVCPNCECLQLVQPAYRPGRGTAT